MLLTLLLHCSFQHPVSDFSIKTDTPSETLSRRRHAALSHPDTVVCLFVCWPLYFEHQNNVSWLQLLMYISLLSCSRPTVSICLNIFPICLFLRCMGLQGQQLYYFSSLKDHFMEGCSVILLISLTQEKLHDVVHRLSFSL